MLRDPVTQVRAVGRDSVVTALMYFPTEAGDAVLRSALRRTLAPEADAHCLVITERGGLLAAFDEGWERRSEWLPEKLRVLLYNHASTLANPKDVYALLERVRELDAAEAVTDPAAAPGSGEYVVPEQCVLADPVIRPRGDGGGEKQHPLTSLGAHVARRALRNAGFDLQIGAHLRVAADGALLANQQGVATGTEFRRWVRDFASTRPETPFLEAASALCGRLEAIRVERRLVPLLDQRPEDSQALEQRGADVEQVSITIAPAMLIVLAECSVDDKAELRYRLRLLDVVRPLFRSGRATDAQLDALIAQCAHVRVSTRPFLDWASRQLAADPIAAVRDGVPRILARVPDEGGWSAADLDQLADGLDEPQRLLRLAATEQRTYDIEAPSAD